MRTLACIAILGISAPACDRAAPSEPTPVEAAPTPEDGVAAEPSATPSAPADREVASTPPKPTPGPAPMSLPAPDVVVLPPPPFAYTLRAEAPVKHQGPMPKLVQLSSKRNRITDEEAWFRDNRLSLPSYTIPHHPSRRVHPVPKHLLGSTAFAGPPGPIAPLGGSGDLLPSQIPFEYDGHDIDAGLQGSDGFLGIYAKERIVAVFDPAGTALGAFDFVEYGRASDVRWADTHDGVLYVCTSNLFYATESGGKNAFITAIEIGSGELLWQSEPLVCNTWNFLLREGWILTGYGYTSEPDFVFVLDARTGAVGQRIPVANGPNHLVERDGKLHVRTYDRNYTFALR